MRTLIFIAALATAAQAQQTADAGKSVVELPIKDRLGASFGAVAPVGTGLVRWHASPAAARAAAARSGKPVLLFQLLGRLDEEFC